MTFQYQYLSVCKDISSSCVKCTNTKACMCLVKKRTSWNARQGWVSYDMIGLPSVQVWPASLWVWHWQFRCGAYHCLNTDQSACEKVFMHGTACVRDLKNFLSYLESSTSLDKKFLIYEPNKININKQFFVILFFRCLFHPLSWSLIRSLRIRNVFPHL